MISAGLDPIDSAFSQFNDAQRASLKQSEIDSDNLIANVKSILWWASIFSGAVVAEAVRTLAQKSAVAAKDISQLIRESGERTEGGATIASNSNEAMKEILSATRKVASLISEISTASDEQAHGISQVSTATNQLDQATQANARVAEEVGGSSEELSTTAEALKDLVQNLLMVVSGEAVSVKVETSQPIEKTRTVTKDKKFSKAA